MLETTSEKQEIINYLENKMLGGAVGYSIDYRDWYVGVTADPETRAGQHDVMMNRFFEKQTWSETLAREVERYFLNKGCQGDTGGGKNPTYVYVFLKN